MRVWRVGGRRGARLEPSKIQLTGSPRTSEVDFSFEAGRDRRWLRDGARIEDI